MPEGGTIPRISIGKDTEKWYQVVGVLCHEAMELYLNMMNLRYFPHLDMGNDVGGCIFVFNHAQFSDAAAKTGEYISNCLPDLAKAWKKCRDSKN